MANSRKRWFLGFLVFLAIVWGWRLDWQKTIEKWAPGEWATTPRLEIGSCYAYEYGYRVPGVMDYIPYSSRVPYTIKRGQEKPLWLAVKSREVKYSLEGGALHLTFPSTVAVRNERPWVCLGSGSNSCYVDFNRALHPNGSICLEPLFITSDKKEPFDIHYAIPTKDHQTFKGRIRIVLAN